MMRKQDLANTIRNPINASEAKQLLDHHEKWDREVSSQWKVRANTTQVAVERAEALDYVSGYKGLRKLDAAGTLRA